MHRHLLLLCWLALLPALGCAQYETANWYWMDSSRLQFQPGVTNPVIPNAGALALPQYGYCTSISDPCGNLLFYVEPERIWNANHQVMGELTFPVPGPTWAVSWGKALFAIPKPGSTSEYLLFGRYLFLPSDFNYRLGYLTIDMSLNGGLGGFAPTVTVLMDSISPHFSCTRHQNGEDYWMVGRRENTNQYYAYQITSTGALPPVISTVGPTLQLPPSTTTYIALNSMVFSPDGRKLAMNFYYKTVDTFTYVMNFDPGTGMVSNPIQLASLPVGPIPGAYYKGETSILFSPDASILYRIQSSGFPNPINKKIYQTDLSSGNPALIANSIIPAVFDTLQASKITDIQYGPDGKIYVLKSHEQALSIPYLDPFWLNDTSDQWLGVIQNPNQLGTSCNYVSEGVKFFYGPNSDPGGYGPFHSLPSPPSSSAP